MKKFIIIVLVVLVTLLGLDYVYFHKGFDISIADNKVETFVRTNGKTIELNSGKGYEPFEVKGVNMGSGIPGEWSTDFAIDEETYMRWFAYMQEMGANVLRIYTVQDDTFYNAFYKYNNGREEPLYLIHGVWVNDYVQNSHRDAYDNDFFGTFMEDCRTMIDVVHGKRSILAGRMGSAGSGTYRRDVSPWVLGYILGVEWEDITVRYTDEKYADNPEYTSFNGKYLYTAESASPFEVMLARVGDKVLEYEANRYGVQKIFAFSNWPTTDPFEYPDDVSTFFEKCAQVNVENIKCTDKVISGQFASYHVYPYYPDYLSYIEDWSQMGIDDKTKFINEKGELNAYKAYLSLLTEHHSVPVLISEFGVSTGRGMAHQDKNTNRNQGNTAEHEQGQAVIDCYEDIMSVGCVGGCVFSWQDEWFKRTWNTMYAVDMKRNPYWSDYQTNEQYFGLLSFDPGEEESVCYVDGNVSEWAEEDKVIEGNVELSTKYDEKFMYFLVRKKDLDFESDNIYIPLDITPKSGSNYCKNYGLKFTENADFLIHINGAGNSRMLVQERYESLRSTYSRSIYGFDTYVKENIPKKASPEFTKINMILEIEGIEKYERTEAMGEVYETGQLTYANANPESPDFNSLGDFYHKGDYIEIKIPWQMLNFADPSQMQIHDDYYDGLYGVDFIKINKMYAGVASDTNERIKMQPVKLSGWGNNVTYHERLKKSYYILKEFWNE